MEKLIRTGVFETNSSSTHSLSISNDNNLLDTLYPDDEGNIILNGGEFGWEEETYTDAQTKANYVAVMILLLESAKKTFSEREDKESFRYYTLPPFADENYELCKSNFEDVIKEQTGCNAVIYNCTLDYNSNNWSHIDHQSFEDEEDAKWLLSKEEIRNFIFNPNSVLVTDNDNH